MGSGYDDTPVWRRDPETLSPDGMPEQAFQTSFSPPDQLLDPFPFTSSLFHNSEHEDTAMSGYHSPSGQLNEVMQDPTVQQSLNHHQEPWRIGSRTKPDGGLNVSEGGFLSRPWQSFDAPTTLAPSQASGSLFETRSVSNAPYGGMAESVHSADATTPERRRYRAPVSPRRPSTTARSTRSRGSSIISAHTSASATKRKAEGGGHACDSCPWEGRTDSELKKHNLKHFKPNTCDEPGCTRVDGFTTPNDVYRHKASVHHIYQQGAKIFLCAAPACLQKQENKLKHWPRLDNFRQHIERMHPEEKIDDLVERSTVHIDAHGQNGLPQDLRRTHVLRATERGILVELNPEFSSSSTGQVQLMPPSGSQKSLRPPPQARRPSGGRARETQQQQQRGGANTSASVSNRRSHQYPAKAGRQAHSETSAMPRSMQPPPSVVLHQPEGERMQREASEHLRQLSQAIKDACTEGNPPNQDTILKALQKFQMTGGSPSGEGAAAALAAAAAAAGQPLLGGDKDAAGDVDMDYVMQQQQQERESRSQLKAYSNMSRPGSSGEKGVPCKQCGKVLRRECDLRKHVMRHDKPFGCTFDDCNKSFGSKNDWKRHEQSQHFQSVIWTCRLTDDEGVTCARVRDRPENFRAHLHKKHGLTGEALEKQLADGQIGHNGVQSFWCGFAPCRRVVHCDEKHIKAWDERFDHIGKHLTAPENLKIRDWLPPHGHLTKGEIEQQREADKARGVVSMRELDSDSESESESSSSASSSGQSVSDGGSSIDDASSTSIDPNKLSLSQSSGGDSPGSSSSNGGSSTTSTRPSSIISGSQAHIAAATAAAAAGGKTSGAKSLAYCCACGIGPTTSPSCMHCGHNFCGSCTH